MTNSQSLAGKSAIVTGASRGLGAAIATELAKRGASILITYNSARDDAQKIAEEIQQLGNQAVIVQAGSSDRETPSRVVQAAVENFGKIDIMVNNAGLATDCALQNVTQEFWDEIYDVNVRLPTFLMQAALPHLGPAPRIVNISSIAARAGYNSTSVYSSSKAALEGLTRAWAAELGQKYNATVNCVNPGVIATKENWVDEVGDPGDVQYWEALIKGTPAAPRIGTTDDVAQIVAFLCEERSRWCTGSVVNANGGLVPV